MRNLIIEIGLIICVNMRSLYNSPLHRILEYEMMLIELNECEKSKRRWIEEELRDDF